MVRPVDLLPGLAPKRAEFNTGDGQVRIEVTPPKMFDLPARSVVLTADQYRRYKMWRDDGMMIQHALPDLSPAEREIIQSGLNDEDFARFAGDEND